MAWTTNAKAAESYGLIPPGDYECIIQNAQIKQTTNGKVKLMFSLCIRNDVQQSCQNRYLFLDIWRKLPENQNDADKAADGFNFAQITVLSTAAGIPDGFEFQSIEHFLQVMVGKCIRATCAHDSYGGKVSEKVDQLRGVNKTQFPECRHKQQQNGNGGGSPAYQPPRPQGFAPQPPQQAVQSMNGFEEMSLSEVPF